MYGSYIFDIHTIFLNPYLFLQPLKLATSNFVHNLGSTSSMPKTTFRTNFSGGVGLGAHQKFWDPILISTTVEVSNFKFGTGTAYLRK